MYLKHDTIYSTKKKQDKVASHYLVLKACKRKKIAFRHKYYIHENIIAILIHENEVIFQLNYVKFVIAPFYCIHYSCTFKLINLPLKVLVLLVNP